MVSLHCSAGLPGSTASRLGCRATSRDSWPLGSSPTHGTEATTPAVLSDDADRAALLEALGQTTERCPLGSEAQGFFQYVSGNSPRRRRSNALSAIPAGRPLPPGGRRAASRGRFAGKPKHCRTKAATSALLSLLRVRRHSNKPRRKEVNFGRSSRHTWTNSSPGGVRPRMAPSSNTSRCLPSASSQGSRIQSASRLAALH